jgi:hypothetical protein
LFNWHIMRAAILTTAAIIIIIACSPAVEFDAHALASSPSIDRSTVAAPFQPAMDDAENLVSVVAAPDTGRPGDTVKVSFSSGRPGLVIDTCSAGFAGATAMTCASPATDPVVTASVPDNAASGPVVISWGAFYHYELQAATGSETVSGNADGSIPFTVLPPEPTISASADPVIPGQSAGPQGDDRQTTASPAGDSSAQTIPVSGTGSPHQGLPVIPGILGILGILLIASLTIALIARRTRTRPAAPVRGPSPPSPAAEQVRAEPHPDPNPRVTVRATHQGLTPAVRLEPHEGNATVHVQEV